MRNVRLLAAVVLGSGAGAVWAQDTRTVTEPSFPPVCSELLAQLSAGPAGLPASSETLYDTAAIQSALDGCRAGRAVELRAAGPNDAFLIAPIRIPPGVTLLVDGGVTVFASRNPRDYDAGAARSCGTIAASGSGCLPLISANRSDGAGLMGYGVIDGRGHLPLLIDGKASGASWWDLARQAQAANLSQNCPRMLQVSNTNGFTLYKITLRNSPNFHVALGNDINFTAWGVKIITPYDARNTDGIDPGYSRNVTITNCYISTGDDNVAVSGSNSPGASDISVVNNHFGDGHGASIGSYTQAGVSNVIFDHISFAGNRANGSQNGIRIKSDASRGGLVQNITYSNICMRDVRNAIVFDPFYTSGATGNLIPQYKNITLRNVHATTGGMVKIQGHDAGALTTITLDNVQVDGIRGSDLIQQYTAYTLGPDPVNFASMLGGTGVTVTDRVTTSNPPYACPASVFPPLMGELIPGPAQIALRQKLSVEVQLIPTKALSYQTYLSNLKSDPDATLALPAPAGTVTIYDGPKALGAAAWNGGPILSIPVGNLGLGTHVLNAIYSGDSNYPAISFGNYVVKVTRRKARPRPL